jgi:hypothetical protein
MEEINFCKKRDCWDVAWEKMLCVKHYFRQYIPKKEKICIDCQEENEKLKAVIKNRYCRKHYHRRKRKGEFSNSLCFCGKPSFVRDLCLTHYERNRGKGKYSTSFCIVCKEKKTHARNLCNKCYEIWHKEEKTDDKLEYVYWSVSTGETISERIFSTIYDMVHFSQFHNGIDYKLWQYSVYKGRPEWAAQRQWSRMRHQMDRYGVPYEEKYKNGIINLYFSYTPFQLYNYVLMTNLQYFTDNFVLVGSNLYEKK